MLNHLLTRYDLEAFATNEYGEGVYLGKPESVKTRKNSEQVVWKVERNITHVSNLDKVVLYEGRKIVGVIPVTPFRAESVTEVKLYVR